jgi:hypothetical protein
VYVTGTQADIENPNIVLPPGQYKFAVFHVSYPYYALYRHHVHINNSSFGVISNNATVTIDKNQYKISDDGGQIFINFSLTTQQSIPLIGPYQVQLKSLVTNERSQLGLHVFENNNVPVSTTFCGILNATSCWDGEMK